MKAERRHELKSNTLAAKLVTIPDTGKKFAGRVVLVCALVAVASFLIFNRITKGNQDKLRAAQDLASARQLIDQLREPPNPYYQALLPTSIQLTSDDAQRMVQGVIDTTTDSKLLAEAWVAMGDLDWILANSYYRPDGSPMLPGASSQPSMRPKQDRDALLKASADAYHEVVERYSSEKLSLVSAQFGLAAIAENRGAVSHDPNEWLAAAELYKTILKNDDAPAAMKAQAKYQLDQIPELQKPILLGIAEKPAPPAKPLSIAPEPLSTAPIGVLAPRPATTQSTTIPSSFVPPPLMIPSTSTSFVAPKPPAVTSAPATRLAAPASTTGSTH